MPFARTAPERQLAAVLRRLGAPEWEESPGDLGFADFAWRHKWVLVFADGCQWHGCPAHHDPAKNAEHGISLEGTARQRHRDRTRRAALRAAGYAVLAFWEHEIAADAGRCGKQVMEALG